MQITLFNPVQAHQAFKTAWMDAKAHLMAGHRLVLSVKQEKRSGPQNRRYWGGGVLAQIADQATVNGKKYSAEVWHELFKKMFIGVVELPDGSMIGESSTNMTKGEFSEFCTKVEAYAATELGVVFYELERN